MLSLPLLLTAAALGGDAPQRPILFCVDTTTLSTGVYIRPPRRCGLVCPACGTGDDSIAFRGLRWRGWGEPVARARGRVGGEPGRIRLSRLRRCGDPDVRPHYSRVRLTVGGAPTRTARPYLRCR